MDLETASLKCANFFGFKLKILKVTKIYYLIYWKKIINAILTNNPKLYLAQQKLIESIIEHLSTNPNCKNFIIKK